MAQALNLFFLVFSLACIAGALFGRGERGTISSRVRRVMLFLAGLLGVVTADSATWLDQTVTVPELPIFSFSGVIRRSARKAGALGMTSSGMP